MKDILLLCLILFCFVSFSKEKKLFTRNTIDTKEKQKKFIDIENKIFFNNNSLEKVYALNVNEKKNIAINNPTKFIFVLKNLTLNSEMNLLIGPNGNNIQFENIIINDEKLSNVNASNINKIYYKIQNETVRVEIRANLKDKEKKNNSFYISLLHIRKKIKDDLYISAIDLERFSVPGCGVAGSVI